MKIYDRLAPGHAMCSHAAFCAQRCGIGEDIIRRAEYIKTLADSHELETLQLEALGLLDDDEEDDGRGDGATREARAHARSVQDAMHRFVEWDIESDVGCSGGDETAVVLRCGLTLNEKLREILGGGVGDGHSD